MTKPTLLALTSIMPDQMNELIEKCNVIELYKENKHPLSATMPYLTWAESAQKLLDILMGDLEPTSGTVK